MSSTPFLKNAFHDLPGLLKSIWGKLAGLGHFFPGAQTFSVPDSETLVVYVHGFLHDKSAFRKYAEKTPGSWMLVNLPSTFCGLEESAGFVVQEIQKFLDKNRSTPQIYLVGHSWGGIICSFLSTSSDAQKRFSIAKVVCVASPFHGTKRVFWKPSPSLKLMDYDAEELSELRAKVVAATNVHYLNLYTPRDHVVIPWNSCLISEKSYRHIHQDVFPDLGHHSFLYDDEVVKKVMNYLFTK